MPAQRPRRLLHWDRGVQRPQPRLLRCIQMLPDPPSMWSATWATTCSTAVTAGDERAQRRGRHPAGPQRLRPPLHVEARRIPDRGTARHAARPERAKAATQRITASGSVAGDGRARWPRPAGSGSRENTTPNPSNTSGATTCAGSVLVEPSRKQMTSRRPWSIGSSADRRLGVPLISPAPGRGTP